MKREPQSLTVHLRHAAHRVHRAAWIINDGATALHCGRTAVHGARGSRREEESQIRKEGASATEGLTVQPLQARSKLASTLWRMMGQLSQKRA
jgi:hypothetical protein